MPIMIKIDAFLIRIAIQEKIIRHNRLLLLNLSINMIFLIVWKINNSIEANEKISAPNWFIAFIIINELIPLNEMKNDNTGDKTVLVILYNKIKHG